ncbi:MAG: type II toxin-antitoxin system death-on-curing family toxin [Actinomycetota bacterium]
MRYLTADEVVAIHMDEVGAGLSHRHLLESAVARPQASWDDVDLYPDIHTKGAALLYSLVKNHAFIEGNKRTAVLSMVLFFNLNGLEVAAEQGELVDLALAVEGNHYDPDHIAVILKGLTRDIRLPEEHEAEHES